ncbi:hypothetical protein RHSIM_Rhsim11G0096000 [Rhododendron simsii]|uniref:Uncharacterized protein n=1 Tax=Rhododendron simsii TaxID=118357 RepID=A0A834G9D5_RHOSS|nr:hypothetical protein RHSIM_Rhsim11G0096000 [Rhododendron simsii]
MKRLIILLIITGLALLCLQANGRRLFSEETEKDGTFVLLHDTQMRLDGVKKGATKIGSAPKVDEKETSNDAYQENSSTDDQEGNSYGRFGDPDASSTDTHHVFTDENRPNPH